MLCALQNKECLVSLQDSQVNHGPQALGKRGSREFGQGLGERREGRREGRRKQTWKLTLMALCRGCRHMGMPKEVRRIFCPHVIMETLGSKADVIWS